MVAGISGQRGLRGFVKHKSDVLDAAVVCAGVCVCVLESELDLVSLLLMKVGNSCRGKTIERGGEYRAVGRLIDDIDDVGSAMTNFVDVSLTAVMLLALAVTVIVVDAPWGLNYVARVW